MFFIFSLDLVFLPVFAGRTERTETSLIYKTGINKHVMCRIQFKIIFMIHLVVGRDKADVSMFPSHTVQEF